MWEHVGCRGTGHAGMKAMYVGVWKTLRFALLQHKSRERNVVVLHVCYRVLLVFELLHDKVSCNALTKPRTCDVSLWIRFVS